MPECNTVCLALKSHWPHVSVALQEPSLQASALLCLHCVGVNPFWRGSWRWSDTAPRKWIVPYPGKEKSWAGWKPCALVSSPCPFSCHLFVQTFPERYVRTHIYPNPGFLKVSWIKLISTPELYSKQTWSKRRRWFGFGLPFAASFCPSLTFAQKVSSVPLIIATCGNFADFFTSDEVGDRTFTTGETEFSLSEVGASLPLRLAVLNLQLFVLD